MKSCRPRFIETQAKYFFQSTLPSPAQLKLETPTSLLIKATKLTHSKSQSDDRACKLLILITIISLQIMHSIAMYNV